MDLPVARVAVVTGLAHLDRTFDYAVPERLAATALPGTRVRVRFADRPQAEGWLLERTSGSPFAGTLSPLRAVVSDEQVLTPEVKRLCRAVAERQAGLLTDVIRLAVPPRHGRVEAEEWDATAPPSPASSPAARQPRPVPGTAGDVEPGPWSRYPTGPAFLRSLAAGGSPRAVWSALPGPHWPDEVARAVGACRASGRGSLVVVPDGRDLERVAAALREQGVAAALLPSDLGPAKRYRAWLRVLRGQDLVAVGHRSSAFAPVANLGLLVVWDDGDDLHAEPHAPYPHVREVLALRSHHTGAALLVGGFARTAEAQQLIDSGWARPLVADRAAVRSVAPAVVGTSEDQLSRDPHAQAARLPHRAFQAARTALAAGAPVLVQVPRRGYVPSLACIEDRTRAQCAACSGPLALTSGHAVATCRWCGRPNGDWRCRVCDGRRLRALVVGSGRTAEELGRAFPGHRLLTSGRDGQVLASVTDTPALVVSTPGAEPVAADGYGAVLLLDGWALLGRPDLRAGEEALRRWCAAAALARPGAPVVVVADHAHHVVQALMRWDPAWAAERELAARLEVGLPPAARMASVTGPAPSLRAVLAGLPSDLAVEVLGPVPLDEPPGAERALLRVPPSRGRALAEALKTAASVRSAAKLNPVRVEVDPRALS